MRITNSGTKARYARVVGAASLLVMASALSACGSDGDSGSSDGAVVVQLIGPFTGSNGAYDPWKSAVIGAVDAINKNGDAGDHKIKLEICDAQQSANTQAACGSKTVRNKAVAALTMGSNEQAYLPYLEKAGIPTFGFMVDAKMYTSPVSYSTASAGAAAVQGVLGLAKREGCEKLVLLRADPQPPAAVAAYAENWKNAAKTIGIDTEIVQAQPGAADMSSFAAKAVGIGSDCMDVVGYGADEVSLIKAVVQADPDEKIKLYTTPSLVSPDTVASLGKILDRITGVSFVWDTSEASQAAHPGIKKFAEEIAEFAPKPNQLDNNSEVMWSQAHAIAEAISKVDGAVTAKKVKEALDAMSDYDPGTGPKVSFSAEGTDPVPSRMFAPYGVPVKWVDGKAITEGDFFNLYTGETVAG